MELIKSQKMAIAIQIVLLILLGIIAFMFYDWYTNEGRECTTQPFLYGGKKMSERYGGELYCRCDIFGDTPKLFTFTDKEFNPDRDKFVKVIDPFEGINISNTLENLKGGEI